MCIALLQNSSRDLVRIPVYRSSLRSLSLSPYLYIVFKVSLFYIVYTA